MTNQAENPNAKKKYDLEDRTARFGEAIIEFAKRLSRNPVNDQLIKQIVRSGTSIGANYMEANGASSKKDFKKVDESKLDEDEKKIYYSNSQSDNGSSFNFNECKYRSNRF